jgi:hypothetical protein
VDPLNRPALGGHPGALVGQIQVLEVEIERLAGSGCGLIQQPPQRLVPQPQVVAAPQRLQLGPTQGPGSVGVLPAPREAAGRVGGQPAVGPPPGDRRTEGG